MLMIGWFITQYTPYKYNQIHRIHQMISSSFNSSDLTPDMGKIPFENRHIDCRPLVLDVGTGVAAFVDRVVERL